MTKRKIEYWVIPPNADGEFVANMEEVLETYEKAYDRNCPVVCMDEQPVQLIGETRVPIPATKEHPERVEEGAGHEAALDQRREIERESQGVETDAHEERECRRARFLGGKSEQHGERSAGRRHVHHGIEQG